MASGKERQRKRGSADAGPSTLLNDVSVNLPFGQGEPFSLSKLTGPLTAGRPPQTNGDWEAPQVGQKTRLPVLAS